MTRSASEATDRAHQVVAYIDERRQDLIDFAAELVATPSMNPPGDETRVVATLQDRLRRLGLPQGEIVAAEPHRPNLIVRLAGEGGSPTLLLNGHTDTKPVGEDDLPLWETDPLTPTFRDGRMHGLGTTDMKGGLAAILYAAAALARLDPPLTGNLLLAFTADEEATTGYGARYLVRNHPLEADAALVAEPNGIQSGFEYLPLVCRGSFYFKVKVYGTQTHASISDQVPAVNASVKMAWVLWRLARDLRVRHQPHPLVDSAPTITPGVLVSGGVYYGVHPGYAEFATDIRLPPGATPESAREDVEAFLADLAREDPELQTELEVVGGSAAIELDGTHPFVQSLLAAGSAVLGRELPFGAFPGYTDAHQFQGVLGIPTVSAYGPGLLPLAHGPNESVAVEDIVRAAKIYALAALDYLG